MTETAPQFYQPVSDRMVLPDKANTAEYVKAELFALADKDLDRYSEEIINLAWRKDFLELPVHFVEWTERKEVLDDDFTGIAQITFGDGSVLLVVYGEVEDLILASEFERDLTDAEGDYAKALAGWYR